MGRHPQRYSLVPWLGPPDLDPLGLPEVTIEREETIAHLLRIPTPFGRNTDVVLRITANRRTGVIALNVECETAIPPPVDLRNLHSNPRRQTDDDYSA